MENLETVLHDFPRDQREADQPVVPWIALLDILKRDATFVFLDLQVLSKVIASSLAWTFASLLTPSGAAC